MATTYDNLYELKTSLGNLTQAMATLRHLVNAGNAFREELATAVDINTATDAYWVEASDVLIDIIAYYTEVKAILDRLDAGSVYREPISPKSNWGVSYLTVSSTSEIKAYDNDGIANNTFFPNDSGLAIDDIITVTNSNNPDNDGNYTITSVTPHIALTPTTLVIDVTENKNLTITPVSGV